MTLYLVKYGGDDYRLHREGGTEITTFDSDPRGDVRTPGERVDPTPDFVDAIVDDAGGSAVAVLDDPVSRRDHTDALRGNWNFRDVDEHGRSEVPW